MSFVDAQIWYVLKCYSGRDFEIGRKLRRLGFEVWSPSARTKRVRARSLNAEIIVRKPIMPGYLFLGFRDDSPGWAAIYERGLKIAVIGGGRMVFAFDAAGFARIRRRIVQAMRNDAGKARPARGRRIVAQLREGDEIEVRIAGEIRTVTVAAVRDERIVALFEMFGGARPILIPLEAIAEVA